MSVKTFLETEYMNYAISKVVQRLPHSLDGLGQTQRKIIEVIRMRPTKELKTAEVYSLVLNDTGYKHGDMSVNSTTATLARSYDNNINILNEDGSFGYRTEKRAAGARYTGTSFSKIGKLIFRTEDDPILNYQWLEGKKIEPEFLLPVVSLATINGYIGIAIGFANKTFSRNPIEVINYTIDFLNKKSLENYELLPYFNNFAGDVSHVDGQIIIKGKFEVKGERVIITEVPLKYDRATYILFLKKLKEKGYIKGFKENCKKNDFYFNLEWISELEPTHELLGLVEKHRENLTFLTSNNDLKEIKVFNDIKEYLNFFIVERLKYYEIRKNYILSNMQNNINIKNNIIKFIDLYNENKISFKNLNKKEIIDILEANAFDKIENSYNYILKIPIYNLSKESVIKLSKEINELQKEYDILFKKKPENIYIKELKEILKFMKE